MGARQLSNTDLNDIKTTIALVNEQQQSGEMTLEDAIAQVQAAYDLMDKTYDPAVHTKDGDPERWAVWTDVKGLLKTLNGIKFDLDLEKGPEFPAGSSLSIQMRTKLQEVKRVINSIDYNKKVKPTRDEMSFVPDYVKPDRDGMILSEEYALTRLAMLNNYGKGIDEQHDEMKKLRQRYHDSTLDSYDAYCRNPQHRRANRDAAILNKIQRSIKDKKYSDLAKAEAVANRLQPSMPSDQQ